MPFRSWCTVCQRAEVNSTIIIQSRRSQLLIRWITASTRFMEKLRTSRCSHFVETVTSMSGAVIVPDLSANQVAIKAVNKFIAINGFTKAVLQCDGHSELLALQQVGCDMSLPTQVSPPYNHQSQGTVEKFHETLHGQARAIKIGLADHLGLRSDHIEGSLLPWIVQHAIFRSTAT